MDRDPETVELLRQRLDAMEAQQRARGGVADPSFWDRAAAAPSMLPDPAGCFAGQADSAARQRGSARARRRGHGHARVQAPAARVPYRGCGPWSGTAVEDLERVDFARLSWADDEVMSDPGWIEATMAQSEALDGADGADGADDAQALGPRDGGPVHEPPTLVMAEALAGAPLGGHGADVVVFAVECVAQARAAHEVMLVNLVTELEARAVQSPGGLSRVDWLRGQDPTLSAAAAKAIVTVGAAFAERAGEGVVGSAVAGSRWSRLRMLVTTQQVTAGNAAQVVEFAHRVGPVADPADLTDAVEDLTGQARVLRPEELARLVRHHTEQVRPPRDDSAADEGRRQARGLWFGQPNTSGMLTMRALLDPEAAAILKAAVDPLSVPCPRVDEQGRTIERDPRSPAKRRADALVEIVRRGVAAADGVPVTDKAKVVVLIDWDALRGDLDEQVPDGAHGPAPSRRGRGTARTITGDVLSAETARRIACDAGIIPMVLGREGEPLDVGRERRLVTKGLRLALTARDQGCTFPGCSIPAQWTDAHHVVHWARGGTTSLLTMALLCERHHTHVHRYDLTATVTATSVTWHV